jgi:hypothetical protein
MNELFLFLDDHFKIFILIWLKLREYYLESKNKGITLPFIVKKTLNFLKKMRIQCKNIKRFRKIAKFIYYLELELVESEKFIDKLQHFAIAAEIFGLPEPITNILNNLGLNSSDDIENNLFTKKINDLFKDIDEIDLEQKVNILDENLQDEGTLINFLKNKKLNNFEIKPKPQTIIQKEPKNEPKNESQYTPEPKFIYNIPVSSFKSTNISRIPRYGATPNPRTIYRHH